MKTSLILVNAIRNGGEFKPSIYVNYFGAFNLRDKSEKEQVEIYSIIEGIYEGLIKQKGVSAELLDKCFWTNRLDELIQKKYRYNKSYYWEKFQEKKIILGPTPLLDQFNKETGEKLYQYNHFEILDDDHCPTCSVTGYITRKNGDMNCPTDCYKCDMLMCKKCIVIYDDEVYCSDCVPIDQDVKQNTSVDRNIQRKIRQNTRSDQTNFGVLGNIKPEDVKKLLEKQNHSCWNCQEKVSTSGWKPYCCYQFSIDRIDNSKPHNNDNCRIACYYCNSRNHPSFDQHGKVCKSNCHTEKKRIPIRS